MTAGIAREERSRTPLEGPRSPLGSEGVQRGLLLRALVEASQASPEEAVACIAALTVANTSQGACDDEDLIQCFCAIGQVLRQHASCLPRFAAVLASYVQAKESAESLDVFEACDAPMFSLAAAIFLNTLEHACTIDTAVVCEVLNIFVAKQPDEVTFRLLHGAALAKVGGDAELPDWARDSPFAGERISIFGGSPSVETVCCDMEYMMEQLTLWAKEPGFLGLEKKCQLAC
jgi:hypothetical protein